MVLGFRAWCWMAAFGGALACNPDTSGQGGGDTATVDPTNTSTTGGSSTGGTTGTPPGSSTGAADTTATSTGEPPGTEGSTTASVDTADTEEPPEQTERCNSDDVAIPDDDDAGIYSLIEIPAPGTILGLHVVVRASHPYVGDLDIELTKDGPTVALIHNLEQFGCSGDDIDVVFRDDAAVTVDAACMIGAVPALAGDVQPDAPLGPAFVGQNMLGNWRLHVVDRNSPDSGTLTEWCLRITYQ